MSDDIRVPAFSLNAGGAALTFRASAADDHYWTVEAPNHLGIAPSMHARGSFDEVRIFAERLAGLLARREESFQHLRAETVAAIRGLQEAPLGGGL